MQFDARNSLTATRDAFGNFTYHEYDEVGNRTKTLLPPQNGSSILAATYFAFDKLNRQQRTTDSHLSSTYTGFDAVGNATLRVNERGVATYHTFDAANRPFDSIDLGRARTYFAYDRAGNVVRQDVEQGWGRQPWGTSPWGGERVSTYFFFDALNRVQTSLSPSSLRSPTVALTYTAYDAAGNRTLVHIENPLGEAGALRNTYFEFDRLNRVVKTIDPPATALATAGFSVVEFDAAGNVVKRVDQEGRPAYFRFDDANRQDAQWNAFLDTSYLEFDLRNAVTKRIDAEGRTTYFQFDALGRTSRRWNALGEIAYSGFDARSEQVVSINPRGYPTYFSFDLIGRTTKRKDALGGERYFGFDVVGNKVLELDELGNPSYWAFDQANRVRAMRDAAQNQTYFGWDAVGNLRVRREPDGSWTSFGYFGYDANRRPTRQSFSTDPWIYFSYDALGNMTQVVDETGTNVFEFDALNRLTKKVTLAGAVYYGYDKSGMKTSFKDPELIENVHVYDAAGRLSKVHLVDLAKTAYYAYDRAGALVNKPSPGNYIIAYYDHDTAGRLSTLTNWSREAGQALSSFDHTRDANGNVIKEVKESGSGYVYYEFDALDRLRLERHFDPSNTPLYGFYYNYDAASNRYFKHDLGASVTNYYTFDSRNLLAQDHTMPSDATTVYEWDSRKRLKKSFPSGATGDSHYYTYNQRNMATQIQDVNTAGGSDENRYFSFNGVGERVVVVDGGTTPTRYFAYDGRNLALEKNSSGTTVGRYRHNAAPVKGSAIFAVVDGRSFAFGFNRRGDVVNALTALEGARARYQFDSFGGRLWRDAFNVPTDPRMQTASDAGLLALSTTLGTLMISGGGVLVPSAALGSTGPASFLRGVGAVVLPLVSLPILADILEGTLSGVISAGMPMDLAEELRKAWDWLWSTPPDPPGCTVSDVDVSLSTLVRNNRSGYHFDVRFHVKGQRLKSCTFFQNFRDQNTLLDPTSGASLPKQQIEEWGLQPAKGAQEWQGYKPDKGWQNIDMAIPAHEFARVQVDPKEENAILQYDEQTAPLHPSAPPLARLNTIYAVRVIDKNAMKKPEAKRDYYVLLWGFSWTNMSLYGTHKFLDTERGEFMDFDTPVGGFGLRKPADKIMRRPTGLK